MSTPSRDAQWEQHKLLIWKSWIRDRLPVSIVLAELRYLGLQARKPEFDSKVSAWGYRRNVPRNVWHYVDFETKKSKAECGYDIDVFISGARVPRDKVNKTVNGSFRSTLDVMRKPKPSCPLGFPISLCSPISVDPGMFTFEWPASLPWAQFSQFLPVPDLSGSFSNEIIHSGLVSSKLLQSMQHRPESSLAMLNINHLSANLGALMPESFDGEHLLCSQGLTNGPEGVIAFMLRLLLYRLSNNLEFDEEDLTRFFDYVNLGKIARSFPIEALQSATAKTSFRRLFDIAVRHAHQNLLAWLLGLGMNPRQRFNPGDCLPLCLLVESICIQEIKRRNRNQSQIGTIALFVSHGALVTERCCATHGTPLDCAAFYDNTDILKHLMQHGENQASDFLVGLDWKTLYLSATEKGYWQRDNSTGIRDDSSFKYLLDTHASDLPPDTKPLSILKSPEDLIKTVSENNIPLVKHLVEIGVDLNCQDEDGVCPLGAAINNLRQNYNRHQEMVETLLELGASPNYQGFNKRTKRPSQPILSIAIIKRLHACTKLLLDKGADPNMPFHDKDKDTFVTPLEFCAKSKSTHAMKLLLGQRAIVRGKELLLLLENSKKHDLGSLVDTELITALVKGGLDLDEKTSQGETALQIAMKINRLDIAHDLIKAGASNPDDFAISAEAHVERILKFVRFGVDASKCIAELKQYAPNYSGDQLLSRTARDYVNAYKLPFPSSSRRELIDKSKKGLPNVLTEYPCAYSHDAVCRLLNNAFWPPLEDSGPGLTEGLHFAKEILKRRPPDWKEHTDDAHCLLGSAACLAVRHGVFEYLDDMLDDMSTTLPTASKPWLDCYQFIWTSTPPGAYPLVPAEHSSRQHSVLDRLILAGYKPGTAGGLAAAIFSENSTAICQRLIKEGFNPRRRFSWSPTTLQIAVDARDIELVQTLLVQGVDVNAPPPWKGQKLRYLEDREENKNKILSDLQWCFDFKIGGSRRSENYWARTALQLSVETLNVELISIMLNARADVNAPAARDGGATALQIAAMTGHVGIAQLLISRGADINAKGAQFGGCTALEGAAMRGRLDMVQLLLERGCDVQSSRGRRQFRRAVLVAEDDGHEETVSLLKQRGSWTLEDEAARYSVFYNCCDILSEKHHFLKKVLNGKCPRRSPTWYHIACCDWNQTFDDSQDEPHCREHAGKAQVMVSGKGRSAGPGEDATAQPEDSHARAPDDHLAIVSRGDASGGFSSIDGALIPGISITMDDNGAGIKNGSGALLDPMCDPMWGGSFDLETLLRD